MFIIIKEESGAYLMEERDSEVPLPPSQLVVGIIYNLKKGIKTEIEDAEAEYDSIDTVNAIKTVLENHNIQTVLIEADVSLSQKLRDTHIDIAFNIAEGIRGRGREAQVPALLNMFDIPFTGSDETTLCVALDKALTKRLLSTYNINTPDYTLISKDFLPHVTHIKKLNYPVIVKPNAEGSSKGISNISIAESEETLYSLAEQNIGIYKEDMLAEEYIEGREFTVGIIGNGNETRVFSPMEIIFTRETQGDFHVYSYNVKKDYKKYIRYECPADIDKKTEDKMFETARCIYDALGCRDFARIDFRISKDGYIYFIEINPLPGLAPGYSDYPMLAGFCGVSYDTLIINILNAAVKRCGIKVPDGVMLHE
jgi:D-alanine-D-alanine ligase